MKADPKFDLNLHIDELILHGFEHLDRAELGAAVQHSLTRLFNDKGLPSSISRGGQVNRLDGGSISMSENAGVSTAGKQIAQSIYRSFQS